MFATWIGVEELKFGMHVVKLDRPWIGSGLPIQGFRITTERHLQRLREICTNVCVTGAGSQSTGPAPALAGAGLTANASTVHAEWEDGASEERRAALTRAIKEVAQPFDEMHRKVQRILGNIRAGGSLRIDDAIESVEQMVEVLPSNPDPWLWLTELRSKQEFLVQHCTNVAVLSVAFGAHMGMSGDNLRAIGLAALFHDAGKVRAPSDLMDKNGPLENHEYEALKHHAREGYEFVKDRGAPEETLALIRLLHERNAGDGFAPRRCDPAWDEAVRVLTICDVYDALRSDRAYREALSPDRALQAMRQIAADTLDDDMLHEFVRFIGVYPVGSSVELATGDFGIVMSRHARFKLRPVVMLVRNSFGRSYDPRPCVCLAERDQDGDGRRWRITRLMRSQEADIDMAQIAIACLSNKRPSRVTHIAGLNIASHAAPGLSHFEHSEKQKSAPR